MPHILGIDHVAFYDKPFLKFERLLETYLAFAPRGFTSFSMAMPLWLREKLFQKSFLKKQLKAYAPSFDWQRRLLFTEHHQSHAASAFFASPFEEAIVLTMDDGLPVTVDGTRHDPRGQDMRVEVVGSDDVVAAGLDDRTALRVLDAAGLTPRAPGWESSYERFADAFAAETDAFVALARDGGASPCPPETALEALRVAVACDRSRAEGRPIALL